MKKNLLIYLLVFCFDLTFCQIKPAEPAHDDSHSQEEPDEPEEEEGKNSMVYFRYRVYSDFVGIEDDQPNGLLQTEFYWSWRLARNPFFTVGNTDVFLFYNLVVPELALLKIDEKERYLPALYVNTTVASSTDTITTTVKSLNTVDVIKYANLRSGFKLNVLTLSFPKSRFFVDSYFVHFRTGVRDTTREDDERNINSFGAGFNAFYHTALLDSKFKLDLGYSIFWLRTFSNSYKQVLTSDEVATSSIITADKVSLMNQPTTAITGQAVYVPEEGKTEYFLRFSYITNFLTLRKPDFYNGFVQFQLGISKDLDFFNNEDDD